MFDGTDASLHKFEPFPVGFQLVTGSPGLRTSDRDGDAAQRTLFYRCDGAYTYYAGFPVKKECQKLTVGINFRQCSALPCHVADRQLQRGVGTGR
jgi:hypothetical protein